jgi:pimeloyl-ACP methyl ester carboxylesterase
MATYVLVHGGAHGGWCYQPLARRLQAAGHIVYAPTLTGLGERSHLVSPDVGLEVHVTDVVNVLRYEDLRDVVLVGHSYGGMVITGVADRAGDRIGHLVYLDAARPQHGESLADVTPAIMGAVHADMRVVEGTELVLWPGPDNTYGVTDPATIAWMLERLTPHPWKAFKEPVRLDDEAAVGRIPRTNINCTETMARRPADKRHRALEADNVWEIDTGHDLMLTEPDAVAEMLLRLS